MTILCSKPSSVSKLLAIIGLGTVFPFCYAALPAQSLKDDPGYKLSQKLKVNVVRIQARSSGFGFIVGERNENKLLVVTANHLVRNDYDSVFVGHIEVDFWGVGKSQRAIVLEGYHSIPRDFAVIEVNKPEGFSWEEKCVSPVGKSVIGAKVWYIGRNMNWDPNLRPGIIKSEEPDIDSIIEIEIGVKRGFSGGPVLTEHGLFGMIRSDDGDVVKVVDIDRIRREVKKWNYPWQLSEYPKQNRLWKVVRATIPAAVLGAASYGIEKAYNSDVNRYNTAKLQDAIDDARSDAELKRKIGNVFGSLAYAVLIYPMVEVWLNYLNPLIKKPSQKVELSLSNSSYSESTQNYTFTPGIRLSIKF